MITQPEIRRSVAAWAAEILKDDLLAASGTSMDAALSLDISLMDPTDRNETRAVRLAARWEREYRRLIAELERRADRKLPSKKGLAQP